MNNLGRFIGENVFAVALAITGLTAMLLMALQAVMNRGPWVCAKCGQPCRNDNPGMHTFSQDFFRCGHAEPVRTS